MAVVQQPAMSRAGQIMALVSERAEWQRRVDQLTEQIDQLINEAADDR